MDWEPDEEVLSLSKGEQIYFLEEYISYLKKRMILEQKYGLKKSFSKSLDMYSGLSRKLGSLEVKK